jgi:ferredoxin
MKSGSRKLRMTHVRLDSNACIGCVACTRCENFEMGQDMKAHVVKGEVRNEKCVLDAISNCPVAAIDLLPLPEFDAQAIRV